MAKGKKRRSARTSAAPPAGSKSGDARPASRSAPPARPSPARPAPPVPSKPRVPLASSRSAEHPLARFIPPALMISLALVVVAMTPWTNNLDDIKYSLTQILGPALGLLYLVAAAKGLAPLPPRPVAAGLAAWIVALCLSTLFSAHRWTGPRVIVLNLACAGYFLAAMTVTSRAAAARTFHIFLVALFMAVSGFGFFHYDLLGRGRSMLHPVYEFLYAGQTTAPTPFQSLLYTFVMEARTRLMSTILNRDFYAAFCLLYMPLGLAMALGERGRAFRFAGTLAVVMALVSVFLCKSKGEYFFALLALIFFAGFYAAAIRRVGIHPRLLGAWIGGIAMFLGALLLMNLPSLTDQLKTLSFSVSSRRIIFGGAWGIFLAHPLLGGGPGTFKILFPRFRADNYFEHEISNVTEFAHNYILHILSETGLTGAAAFALFAFAVAIPAFAAAFRAPDLRLRLLIIAVLAGLLGMFGSNMTSTSGFWPIGAVGIWTFMGMLCGLTLQARGEAPPSGPPAAAPPGDRRLYPVAIGLGVLAALLGVREGVRYWRAALAYNQGMIIFNQLTMYYGRELGDPRLDDARRERFVTLFEESAAGFERAITIQPGHLSAYYKLGSIENYLATLIPARQEDHLRSARDVYNTLTEYAPDYAEVHYNLGIINYRLARIAERRLDELPADAEDRRKELEAEIAAFRSDTRRFFESMSAMSQKEEVFTNLGETYLRDGADGQALTLSGIAMEKYPGSIDLAEIHYMAATELGDAAARVRALLAMWRIEPGRRSHLYEAMSVAAEADLRERFDELAEAGLELNPVDPGLWERVAIEAARRDDRARLIDAADKYIRLPRLGPENGEVTWLAAEAAGAENDPAAARRFLEHLAAGTTARKSAARERLAGGAE